MALRPAEHFTEFKVAMWSLSFSRSVSRFKGFKVLLFVTYSIIQNIISSEM